MLPQHLRHQEPKAAGAHHGGAHAGLDPHLLDDAAGCGGRLDEDRCLIVYRAGHLVQVRRRK